MTWHPAAGRPPEGDAGEVADLDEADRGRSGQQPLGGRVGAAPGGQHDRRSPWAAATSICWTTLARHAAVENGRTMPVVPRMEMPPTMPRRALEVLAAMASPPGTEKVTRTGRSVTSATAARDHPARHGG